MRDERGAVMVLGLMLGAFTVAALFYLVDVGYASVWREATQDAADATAFEAAVWEARGMNVIAAINIFIAIAMAVLVAWRLVMFGIGVMAVLAGISCFVPPLAAICPATGPLANAVARMASRDTKVQQNVYKIINVLNKGQIVVASALPILSIVRPSLAVASRPRIESGLSMGTYAIPSVALNRLALGMPEAAVTPRGARKNGSSKGAAPTAPGTGPRTGQGNQPGDRGNPRDPSAGKPGDKRPPRGETCAINRGNQPPTNNDRGRPGEKKRGKKRSRREAGELLGLPLSLPMEQSDDVTVLCGKAGQMMGNAAFAVQLMVREVFGGGTGSVASGGGDQGLGTVLGMLTEGMAPLLCGDFTSPGAAQDLIDRQAGEACKNPQATKKYEADKRADETPQASCERNMKKEARDKQAQNQGGSGRRKEDAAYFADIWGPLANGNMFAQSWAVVSASQDHAAIDRLIGLAGRLGGEATTTSNLSEQATMFAQSEMFFDCSADWDGCIDTAAWQLNWRARMRRVRSPLDLASTSIEEGITRVFDQVFQQEPVQRFMAALPLADIFAQASGSLVSDQVHTATEDLRSQVAQQGGAAARWVIEQGPARTSFIH
jgi:hypothetical protein